MGSGRGRARPHSPGWGRLLHCTMDAGAAEAALSWLAGGTSFASGCWRSPGPAPAPCQAPPQYSRVARVGREHNATTASAGDLRSLWVLPARRLDAPAKTVAVQVRLGSRVAVSQDLSTLFM